VEDVVEFMGEEAIADAARVSYHEGFSCGGPEL
jgi:hypothetical protein